MTFKKIIITFSGLYYAIDFVLGSTIDYSAYFRKVLASIKNCRIDWAIEATRRAFIIGEGGEGSKEQ